MKWQQIAVVLAALVLACTATFAQDQASAEARLKALNIILPAPGKPVGNYVEWVRVGNLLYLAGHGPGVRWKGKGKVGKELTLEQGREAARDSGLQMLATVRDALGSLDKVKRVVSDFWDGKFCSWILGPAQSD